jgi:hypothetical protein
MKILFTILSLALLGSLAVAAGRSDLPFHVLEKGINSGETQEGVKVVRTERAFEEFLKERRDERSMRLLKQVDWDTEQVVIVYGGQQASGGFSVDVKRISQLDVQRLVLEARILKPAPGQIVTMALTTPYTIVKMARQVAPVKLKLLTD